MGTRLPYITCHLYRFHDWGSFFRRTGLTFLGLATRAQSLDISAPDQPDSALITVAHKCAATQFFLSAHQEIDPAGTDAPRGIRVQPYSQKAGTARRTRALWNWVGSWSQNWGIAQSCGQNARASLSPIIPKVAPKREKGVERKLNALERFLWDFNGPYGTPPDLSPPVEKISEARLARVCCESG